MSTFFERVRVALAQKGYQVEGDRELGNGGMGIVILARQIRLDRLVAIKIIRPELHTADANARFIREAQTLASVPHAHIVPVFEADETDGLPYYVMQYLGGETVEHRLRAGSIPKLPALKLGRDLLEALEHAHEHGVIHRDVKPANVFWDGRNAILVDFGIAKRVAVDPETIGEPLTRPGMQVGTRAYMAPEQLAGLEASQASDQYAAALVIYEAYSGRHWLEAQSSGGRRWRKIPWVVSRVLRRALAWKASDRWPDVRTFKRKLWETRRRQYQLRGMGLLAGGLLAGAVIAHQASEESWPFDHPGSLQLVVAPFENTCGPVGNLGERVAKMLVQDLQGYADFFVSGPTRMVWFKKRSMVRVQGHVCAQGSLMRAEVTADVGGRSNPVIIASADTDRLDVLMDTVSFAITREIWNRENGFDPVLPLKALPHSARGLAAWLVAERLFAQARWGSADSAYGAVEAIDSTCWLCSWRHAEVEKWLFRRRDAARAAVYWAHRDSFPPQYQQLILASRQPLVESLETLKDVVHEHPKFLPALFMLADETYHRGPLIGRSTQDAIEAFEAVVAVRPDFLPAQ